MKMVCPECGSDRLLSEERASIGYPITVGEREWDYDLTRDRIVYDESTEFVDNIWCGACAWNGTLAELKEAGA